MFTLIYLPSLHDSGKKLVTILINQCNSEIFWLTLHNLTNSSRHRWSAAFQTGALGWRVTRTCCISVISRPISLKITIKFRYYLGLHYEHLYIYWNPHLDSHSRIQELFVGNHYFRPYILCLSLRAPYVLPFRILSKFITHIIIRMYGHSLSGQNLECRG